MPKHVIDRLKTVQVDEHDGDHGPCPMRRRERVGEPVKAKRPVGKVGQGVMMSTMTQSQFVALALAVIRVNGNMANNATVAISHDGNA